jgi:hypothetical protein
LLNSSAILYDNFSLVNSFFHARVTENTRSRASVMNSKQNGKIIKIVEIVEGVGIEGNTSLFFL